ncbi:acetate/propionate family kinase [Bosea psychrotolerans]|uniref:Acetate kinase n=1 Tax=Bosea psychrotolerans TaxID=1871628 RepID=A0A2S4LXE2_9HYPH|nr:acetate/propionate family kinase [Bosea psychrotolerans]POR47124.1 acetate kinase [Bosea psychrotolerans]
MTDAILALNAGSSSIKFGLFEIGSGDPALLVRGEIEEKDGARRLVARSGAGQSLADQRWGSQRAEQDDLPGDLLGWIEAHLGQDRLVAAGHRIVHGGRAYFETCQLDERAIAALTALTPLAPLHQPRSLAPVRALARLRPDLPQFGCFDTAFHHGLAPPVSRFAIPRAFEVRGIRRYGFHGLSYEFIARLLAEIAPGDTGKRTVVAHLGNGASLCAMRDGKSLDTTMGFSALDGLVMGTRCGALDPGVLLYLQQVEGLSIAELDDLLYRQSGLLGVSGVSGDMRTLLASQDPHAAEAIDLFVFRLAREITAMANTLGGLDRLVFTGGIGEHAHQIRALAARRLEWLGLRFEDKANLDGKQRISRDDSRIEVLVLATDEELTIARHVCRAIG